MTKKLVIVVVIQTGYDSHSYRWAQAFGGHYIVFGGRLMLYPELEEVIGQAIIDREFCAGLLTDRRAQLLRQFELSSEEKCVLMSIRADTLESFAGQLYEWIEAQRPHRSELRPICV